MDATGTPNLATGVGADNDTRNLFISAYPHYDYRTQSPVVASAGHRLEKGQTTTPKTWILAADQPVTHAFSLDIIITALAQPTNAHAADVSTTPALGPHPYGLGYDPTTRTIHVSGDIEGWLYGVNVDTLDEFVALQLLPNEGPSYVEVSPKGSDPGHADGRIWWSWTHPELTNTHDVVGAFDARNHVPSSHLTNVEFAYVDLPGLPRTQPRGLAFDPVARVLYVAEADQVWQIEIDTTPAGIRLTGFNNVQGVAVDPENGNLFVVNRGSNSIYRIKGLRAGSVGEVALFGGPGNGPGQFNDPRGIEVDGQGLVFVVDRGNDRVQVLDGRSTAMTWLMMFGGHVVARTIVGCNGPNTICPVAPGDGFDKPGDVESIDSNTVFVSDSENGRIVRWEHDSWDKDLFPYDKTRIDSPWHPSLSEKVMIDETKGRSFRIHSN
jgi:DNA-binding beta-propeller fold protein YncE